MKKWLTVLLYIVASQSGAVAAEITVRTDPIASVPRVFGTPTPNDIRTPIRQVDNHLAVGLLAGSLVQRVVDRSAFRPQVVAQGPMIRTKGIYPGRSFLYIVDTGKSGRINENGKVWRFDPKTKELTLFFSSDLLITPKWLFYYEAADPRDDRVIVSDYGEEPASRQPGTGVGAKVVSIPVRSDGSAGSPKILHQGPPFLNPEGVTVIGKTVIVSDWVAGPRTTRPESPNDPFNSGRVFALPLDGGEPKILFPERTWVTLIGACQFQVHNGDLYLRLIDIDGGRLDTVYPTFPRSGLARYWTAKVLSKEPLQLGPLQQTPLTEDLPIAFEMKQSGPKDAQSFEVTLLDGARFSDGTIRRTFAVSKLRSAPNFTEIVSSPIENSEVRIALSNLTSAKRPIDFKVESVPKNLAGSVVPLDNKHAGARPTSAQNSSWIHSAGSPILSGSADGTSQALFLFPPKGGTSAVLWQGAPFAQPMGVQFSADGRSLYVTDQAAGPDGKSALFLLPMPPEPIVRKMFNPALQ